MATWAGGMATWAGGIDIEESLLSSTSWVNDDGSTALLQSRTIFNPVTDAGGVSSEPDFDTTKLFLPALSR
jgi:hypothetical protein